MKLAISSQSASIYSETFISMQMERLPCVLRIHGGPVCSETVPGGSIKPLTSLRGLLETAWSVGVNKARWEGPQIAELSRRLKTSKIDCLLANFGTSGVNLAPVCRKASIPLVVHFHGYDAHLSKVVEQHRQDYKNLGKSAGAFIAVSLGMVEALVAVGIPREKIHLIRYGVYIENFTAKTVFPLEPTFFGVGRFVDKKAPYLTVLAFAKARECLPNARLILAGNGELLEASQNLAAALGVSSAIEFPGVLSPQAVAKRMREATAFVQHSLEPAYGPSAGDREGTPVAILEAMMTGLPVISTRHAGIGEVIENERTGLLVEERDVDGMAKAMVRIGQSRSLARDLGVAARNEALLNYASANYITSLHSVLKNVVDGFRD